MRVEQLTERYFRALMRNRRLVFLLAFLLSLGALFFASKLQLKPSLSELLPENLPSVLSLKKLQQRVGGSGVLLVGVKSPSFSANKKFIEDLAEKVKGLDSKELHYFEYKFDEITDYLHRYGLYYLDESELKDVRDEIEKEIERKKDKGFSDFLGLSDEEAEEEGDEKNPLPENLDPRLKRFFQYPDGYLGSKDGKLLVMNLRPSGSSLSISESRRFTEKLWAFVKKLQPSSYHKDMNIQFSGNVQSVIEEFEAIQRDILGTAILLIVLIMAVLFLFFWKLRWILILIGNLVPPIIITLGLTQMIIGHLNTLTAFFSSIVAGTGINYGILFLMRYIQNRKKEMDVESSLLDALRGNVVGTLVASTTTAAAFLSLLFSENRGFSDFGMIGGLGVLLCWVFSFSMLPLLIYFFEKKMPLREYFHPLAPFGNKLLSQLSYSLNNSAKYGFPLLIILAISFAPFVRSLFSDPFEYDFGKLKNKVSTSSGSYVLRKVIQDEVYRMSLTPSVILLNDSSEGNEICKAVNSISDALPESQRVLDTCTSLPELLPDPELLDEAQKPKMIALREELTDLLGHPLLKYDDVGEHFRMMSKKTASRPPTREDLPSQFVQRFREKNGDEGGIAFIYPDNAKPLEDGRNLMAYSNAFSRIQLSSSIVSATGDPFVLADLIKNIMNDGPKVTLLSFILVAILAFLLAGGIQAGAFMCFCLIFAVWMVWGWQGFFGIKYNFINFIALPLTFGLGVDYPINLFVRSRQLQFKNLSRVLQSTGASILLCSLTTIIGYFTLTQASNMALVSFAKLALIGELTCLFAAFILLPLALRFFGKFKNEH